MPLLATPTRLGLWLVTPSGHGGPDKLTAVKHAGSVALADIDALLSRIRDVAGLTERGPGIFYRRSRAFLHFHEDPTGIYADLRSDFYSDFVRMRVNTKAEQGLLLREVRKLGTP